jgi:acetoin utilization deacetylase AcuC-like enzyme
MATGWVFHELYMWHDTGAAACVFPPSLTIEPGEHAENPHTKRRLRNLVEVSGLLARLTPIAARPATEADLTRFHAPDYVARIKAMSANGGGDAGDFAPFRAGSFEIACLSAGGVIAAVEAVLSGQVKNAYALVRPPGHHAERSQGRGFCIFGNIAVAVMHARAVHRVGRVAIVDWDVHHGNGTQQAFYDSRDVLTISLHQDRLFPVETGGIKERGEGEGEGYNINIPLPAGSGHGAYLAAFERVVLPALEDFRPDLIVLACGFDAAGTDPLGRMMLHAGSYRAMTRLLMDAADRLCAGRLVAAHEGGYSAAHVPYCGLAVIEELSGVTTGIADPWQSAMEQWGGQELQPHQSEAIERCRPLSIIAKSGLPVFAKNDAKTNN